MTDDDLRRAYQARLQGSAEPPPTLEELAALLAREGSEAERLELLDRALSDPSTEHEFELLRAISTAGRAEPVPVLRRWRTPFALAASLVLAVSGYLLVRSSRRAEELRAPPSVGAPVPVAPSEGSAVPVGPTRFVWHSLARATGYRLELLSDAGAVAASLETRDTLASLAVPAGGPYRWVVVGLLPDGVEAPSRPRRIRVAP